VRGRGRLGLSCVSATIKMDRRSRHRGGNPALSFVGGSLVPWTVRFARMCWAYIVSAARSALRFLRIGGWPSACLTSVQWHFRAHTRPSRLRALPLNATRRSSVARRRLIIVAALVTAITTASGGIANAGRTATASLTVVQDSLTPTSTTAGSETVARLTVHSSSCAKLQALAIAVRAANGSNFDYPGAASNPRICPRGYTLSGVRTFPPGTYTEFGAYEIGGVWRNLPSVTLTVTGSGPLPNGPAGAWAIDFQDDFNGSSLDLTKWSNQDGVSMNNVVAHAANLAVSGGNLTMTVASATSGAYISSGTVDGAGHIGGYMFPVGSFAEARISFPGSGATIYNWPAWWTSGPNWPAAGEIDIAEGLGTMTVNYHSNGPDTANFGTIPGTWSNAFHIYGVNRKASSCDVYYDGVLVETFPTDDNGATQSLLLNVGSGHTAAYGTAGQVLVDYVRAWSPA
jgi:Glycosyl hydrolases family 16